MLHRSSPDIVLYSLALACPCFLPFMLFVPCKVEMPVTDEAADLAKLIATLFGRLGCQRTLVMSKGDGGKGYEPQPKQMSAFSASVQGVLFLFDFVTLLSFIYRYPFCLQAIAITRRRFRGMADTIHILH